MTGLRLSEHGNPPALDLDDLRQRTLPPVALLLGVVGAVSAWIYLPAHVFLWQRTLLAGLLSLAGLTAYGISRASARAGSVALVAATVALAALAAHLLPSLEPLFFMLAIALSVTMAWPAAALVTAAVATMLQGAAMLRLGPVPYLELWITAYLTTGATLFLAMRSLQGLLGWAWQRHINALRLSEQLRDRQGELNATVKALDLAYRLLQRTNRELAEARQEAEEARHLRDQFAASVSHELRTPLNLVLGFSEIMQRSPEVYGDVNWTPMLRRDVAQIHTASSHLLQLIDDVLDLSRLDAERLPMHRELASLAEIIGEAINTVRELTRGRPVSIRADVDPALPPIAIDATRMRQVMLNLLNNAVRFTQSGEVVVRARRESGAAIISVQDTGIGIEAANLERVFDEFYQAGAAVAGTGAGMGLGLAISKRFVQMHGGRIWAESEVGKGSTFIVSLPLDRERPAISRLKVTRREPLPAKAYADSVLVVGADADIARLLDRHLPDHHVLTTANSGEVERLVADHHPRAVVCNLSLAHIRQLAAELLPRTLPSSVPVIFTAMPCNAWRAELLQVSASLQKPVQRQELLAALAELGPVRDLLIVDDDLGFVELITRILRASGPGYRVRCAFDGREGLEEMRRQRPDALLLDIRIPGMDGPTVLAAMRADAELKSVPVVVISAVDVEEDTAGLSIGVVGMAQRTRWRLADSLGALNALLQAARPDYAGESTRLAEAAPSALASIATRPS